MYPASVLIMFRMKFLKKTSIHQLFSMAVHTATCGTGGCAMRRARGGKGLQYTNQQTEQQSGLK